MWGGARPWRPPPPPPPPAGRPPPPPPAAGPAGGGRALGLALAAAEAGVVLMRPRSGVIDGAPVQASSYFSPAELDHARRFRRPQLAIGLAALGLEAAILAALARRPPAALAARREQ